MRAIAWRDPLPNMNSMTGSFHSHDVHTGVWALISCHIVQCINDIGLIKELSCFGTRFPSHLQPFR